MAMAEYPDKSNGWTVSAGVGSQVSERIKYRALLGWSRYESSRVISPRDNAVYSLSAQWTITDTLKFLLLCSSFYHPSEVDYASSTFSSTLSAGLAKSFVRGKLTGTVDLAYRHEENESANSKYWNYDEDILISRIGLSYRINRFVSTFGRIEYQLSESSQENGWYDYDRWRATFGMCFSY
jgi:lipopolysaccharide assembly outer membrane protein LptD (OstA)